MSRILRHVPACVRGADLPWAKSNGALAREWFRQNKRAPTTHNRTTATYTIELLS
jgi:hypothetical protein